MGTLKNFVTPLHKKTKRDYLERMVNEKVKCSKIAKKYSKKYWDGDRKFGYGGYKYIPGRWKSVAEKLIKNYKLNSKSKILDAGCGKGFLLNELKLLEPKLKVVGFDISEYAINNSHKNIKQNVFTRDIRNKFLFKEKEFDLVISLGTLHNLKIFDLKMALNEISRVGKSSYIMVESYRNLNEFFNMQCWALTCESFFSTKEWLWLYKNFNYNGDYEFIFFE
ncbi:class I SAM-dependent methyltransferase [Pelagibacteraceae bacterium]|jgi:ubiquinone/menaquinone biosynthesis C-methylase UbiE|nr:class I SAM-dependent methyltransferase [Pelagibacteraceae bacterium]